MSPGDKVNVLMVDDQPAKLLAYEVILRELGENLIRAASAKEALGWLLKTDVAVILIDVCMPDLDGFELASMVRNHPRFQQTAIGEWLDTIVDDALNLALVAAIGVGLSRMQGTTAPMLWGLAGCLMLLTYNVIAYRELVKQGEGGEVLELRRLEPLRRDE